MANYGEIDGLNVLVNPKISKDLLRDTMGFKGMLTSDGGGVMRLWNFYHVAGSHAEAAYLAKKAGCDTEIPVGAGFRQLPEYVRAGKLDEECIDESVRRILTIKFAYGLFEHPYVDVDGVRAAMTNDAKQALSHGIAEKSIVMLKNDGVLPIASGAKVALIGPHADSLRYPVSGYTYPAYIEMAEALNTTGSAGTFGGIGDEQAAKEKQPAGVFDSIPAALGADAFAKLSNMSAVLRSMGATTLREELARRFDLAYAEGCKITDADTSGFAEAVDTAEEADVVVLALGGNCAWFNVTGGEGKDRASLELPGVQEQLLEAVVATGKPVVVMLYGPGVFSTSWAAEHAAAILEAWMPGQHAGDVVARILAGELNPSGKMPVTVPFTGQVPIYYNHKNGERLHGWGRCRNLGDDLLRRVHRLPGRPSLPLRFRALLYQLRGPRSQRRTERDSHERRAPCWLHGRQHRFPRGSRGGPAVYPLRWCACHASQQAACRFQARGARTR